MNIKRINPIYVNTAIAKVIVVVISFFFSLCSYSDSSYSEHLAPETQTKITIGCSDWKPYCYFDQGALTGSAYQLVNKVLQHDPKLVNKIDYNFAYIPWNRIYRLALKNENTLIMGLGRTHKRENLFHWLFPLRKPTSVYAYQLASSNLVIDHAEDLLNYRIAVERGSFTEDYLIDLGYKKENILTVSRMDQLLKMALHGRIDGFLLDEKVFAFETKKNNINAALFKTNLMAFEVTEYLAAHKNSSPEVLQQIEQSYAELRKQKKIHLLD